MEFPEIPVIEVAHFLDHNEHAEAECRKVIFSLHQFGVLILKDPVLISLMSESFHGT